MKRRATLKEIKKWMKTLEENRYKRIYNADARRVTWLVNNPLSEVENMPKTIRKKWKMTEYKREKHLAKKYLENLLKQKRERTKISEGTLRQMIREIIEGEEFDKVKEKHKGEREQLKTRHEDEKAGAREKDFETRQKELKK